MVAHAASPLETRPIAEPCGIPTEGGLSLRKDKIGYKTSGLIWSPKGRSGLMQ